MTVPVTTAVSAGLSGLPSAITVTAILLVTVKIPLVETGIVRISSPKSHQWILTYVRELRAVVARV
jgi:hypothetical protein